MEAKHTPGPWECDQIGHEVFETQRMTVIATLPLARTMADARLIAAAPELLEALAAVLADAKRRKSPLAENITEFAHAAIAKAKGGGHATAA